MQKRDSFLKSVILALLVLVLTATSYAQDSDLKPVTEKYAIVNATIIPAPGKVINKGSILIENGIIKSVGSGITIPSDAWVINADSMFVYAGFISGMSNHGIEKPKDQDRRDDRKSHGPDACAGSELWIPCRDHRRCTSLGTQGSRRTI